MLTDSHAHLDDEAFAKDLPEVLTRAEAAGLKIIIAPGTDLNSSLKVQEIAAQYPLVYAAAGFHPHNAGDFNPQALPALRESLKRAKVVALGEVGLDYHYHFSPPEKQKEALTLQLTLAEELKLPVIFHLRNAEEDFYQILKNTRHPLPPGVIHCFSSNLSWAKKFLELGFYLGITGMVSFSKAKDLKEVVAFAPLERLLVETDAPYLAPHPLRGKRNEPQNVLYIGKVIAGLKGLPEEEVFQTTYLNLKKLFKI